MFKSVIPAFEREGREGRGERERERLLIVQTCGTTRLTRGRTYVIFHRRKFTYVFMFENFVGIRAINPK